MVIQWYNRNELMTAIKDEVFPTKIVLDVGAGIRPQEFFIPSIHIIIEPYLPYINQLMQKQGNVPRNIYLNNTWENVMHMFPDKSINTIFAIDVIEHLKKDEGKNFIKEAERIAQNQIVIFTPLGYYPQENTEDNKDRWGLEGGYWQTHRSGWTPDDFNDQWEIFACKDFHNLDQYEKELPNPFGAFWAILNIQKTVTSKEERLFITEMRSSVIFKYCYKRIMAANKERVLSFFRHK